MVVSYMDSCVYGTQGKKVFFVTNNSTKSRAGYMSKFQSLGLDVKAVSELGTCACSGMYIARHSGQRERLVSHHAPL